VSLQAASETAAFVREPAWWQDTDATSAARKMVTLAENIYRDQESRRAMNLRHAKLYFNRDLSSIYEAGTASGMYDSGVYLTLNVTQSCVDTLLAKISRSRPRVQFLTEKGNYSLRRTAKQLTQFLDGVFHYGNLYNDDGRQAFRDATLFGSGVIHTYGDDEGNICNDRVLCDELMLDEGEAREGLKSLRNLFRGRYQHVDAVCDKWLPLIKNREERTAAELAIRTAKANYSDLEMGYRSVNSDMVRVFQGWHLPGSDGKGGRYVVAVNGAILWQQEWKRRKFPFSWLHWNPAGVGMWGRSLAEQLVPIQIKLNDLLEVIDEGQKLNCIPRLYVQNGMVNEDHLSNLVAGIVPVNGDPRAAVQEIVGSGASPEMYREVETWFKRAFEVTGISALSATAEKPQGISSAVALRELLDREDMRFSPVGQAWERFFVDIGEQCVETADELKEEEGRKIQVQVPGDKFLESIDWAKLDIKREQYVMKPQPTSTLPTTPAGKREYAIELYQSGGVTRAQFLEMLELPDTTASVSLLTAALEIVERDVELILDEGKYRSPEPLGDPQLTYDYALMAYLRARNEDVAEERLDAMRRYVSEAQENLPQPAPANTNAMAPAPVMSGVPAPAPVMAPAQMPAPGPEVLAAATAAPEAMPAAPAVAAPPMEAAVV